jgi:hypothetical protein
MPLTKLNSASVIERLPVGSVLQTVNTKRDGTANTTPASDLVNYTDTGLFISITPTYNNSKILVFVSTNVASQKATSGNVARYDIRLVNNDASETAYENHYTGTDHQTSGNLSLIDSFQGYFSPASTNSQTYKVQARVAAGASSQASLLFLNWYSGSLQSITAMEIKG